MRSAVLAVAEVKFGPNGIFRGRSVYSEWKDSQSIAAGIPELSSAAVGATIAYCEYVWQRYGRFPAHLAPFRTVLGFQASHLDLEFYDRFYRAEAIGRTQREWTKEPR